MLRVGLTGGIGAGKSSVATRLVERGAWLCDADALAREVVAPGTEGLAEVVATFGAGVLSADGSLDRPALGAIVFGDEAALRTLNGITHPRIGARTRELVAAAEASGATIWVHDVPLLVETGMAALNDAVVVVEAPLEVRLTRLEQRGVPREDALRRMASQASDEERRAVATHVIDNGGDLAALDGAVERVWRALVDQAAAAAQPS